MPIPHPLWRTRRGFLGTVYTPVITWTVIATYVALGFGLTVQPLRFERTPSYHNLLVLAHAPVWGCAYFAAAVLLLAWRLQPHRRLLGRAAHMYAIILTLWWLLAFVIRYATDDATTIVNVVSWSVFLSLAARSSSGLDREGTA